jgi:F0F1-type ATP synthase assembly protein I
MRVRAPPWAPMIIFKYIDLARKAKQGYEQPNELLTDLSFGIVEGYFVASMIILSVVTGVSLWLGFFKDIIFFQIIFFLFLILLIGSIILFRIIKRTVARISKKVTDNVQGQLKRKAAIDVEVKTPQS